MSLKQITIDLQDAPDDLEEQIEQTEAAKETLLEKVDEKFPETEDSPGGFIEAPDDYEEKFYELQEQLGELQGQKGRVDEYLAEPDQAGDWDSYEFVFQEPSTEDALYIEGRSTAMADEAEKRGESIDGQMFGVTQMLERLRVDAPESAPENLARKLPNYVGKWFLDTLNEETTVGVDADLGNTSPQEALRSYRNSQQS